MFFTVNEITKVFNIHPIIAQILSDRWYNEYEEIFKFLNPDLNYLPNATIIPHISEINKLIQSSSNICVYGDYDVDGIIGITILYQTLSQINRKPMIYVPSRYKDGYGLNKKAIEEIAKKGCDLLITVDCGISNVEEIAYAKSLGIKVIVTDHHNPLEILPDCIIINPKINFLELKDLCGAGVAWYLMRAILNDDLFYLLDLVALATIADIVPTNSYYNRAIIKFGLERMHYTQNVGLNNLIKISGYLGKGITPGIVGFQLAPRLNAVGRLYSPEKAVELLTTLDNKKASQLASELDEINLMRKQLQKEIFDNIEPDDKYNIIIYQGNHKEGISGLIASDIVKKYNKPAIVFSGNKASCRSIKPLNMFELLQQCDEFLIKYGGHELAAGLTVMEYDKFCKKCYHLTKDIKYEQIKPDLELNINDIDDSLVESLELLEPFGIGNPRPKFISKAYVTSERLIGKEKQHLKIYLNGKFEAILFNQTTIPGKHLNIIYSPEFNIWNGKKTIQLRIFDIKKG